MAEYTLFIFRRDLRLPDNKGLIYAMQNFKNILPIFIFTPEQVSNKNKYKSDNAIQFMIESLKDLDNELRKHKSKLHLFYGDNIKVLKSLKMKNIIFNKDYTPYAIKRDNNIQKYCSNNNINCYMVEDYLLSKIGDLNKKDDTPYLIFTPFYRNGLKYKVDKPINTNVKNLIKMQVGIHFNDIKYNINKNILPGGRSNGLTYLKKIKTFNKYNSQRNMMPIQTTQLSAYIKFGCVSIREVYWKIKDTFGTKNNLLSQIFWREFYYYIAYYYPKVLQGYNFNGKKIKWVWNINDFKKWCNGETGYPIVDAGMRQLNETGYMHNRARLITSNFLNRMLGMDWRKGEQYYATKLTDYDPSVNNGNWQWIASVGVDPKPFNQRLFNPMIQSFKFDKDADYIKTWIPSLKNIPANELHDWQEHYHKYDLNKLNYVKPIVDYKYGRKRSIQMYKK